MNRMPKPYQIEHYRKSYPPGTRIELTADMVGENIRKGTRGTVVFVDDMASIHMEWDNGRTLALIPGEDSFMKIDDRNERPSSELPNTTPARGSISKGKKARNDPAR